MDDITQPILLPEDPSEEELARDWSLSSEDIQEIRRCKGEQARRHFALRGFQPWPASPPALLATGAHIHNGHP